MLSIIGDLAFSFSKISRRKRILGKRRKSSLGGNWLRPIDSCSTAEDADASSVSNKKIIKRNLTKNWKYNSQRYYFWMEPRVWAQAHARVQAENGWRPTDKDKYFMAQFDLATSCTVSHCNSNNFGMAELEYFWKKRFTNHRLHTWHFCRIYPHVSTPSFYQLRKPSFPPISAVLKMAFPKSKKNT